MEKTAMENLIEQLEDKRYKVFGNLAILAFEKAIDMAKSLLLEERQQIEDAAKYATGYPEGNYAKAMASDYYTTKYGEGK